MAVSRLHTHGVMAEVKYEYRFPSGPNGEYLPSYAVAVGCDLNAGGDRAAALADMQNFLTPAPVRHIEGWLVELSAITAGRGRDGFDAEVMLSAYSARLSQYPADVVRHVLLKQAWKWFPTWADLEKMCNAMTGPRKHIIRALEQPPPAPEPVRREPTAEEKARVQALVDELFPMRSPEMRKAAVDEAMKGRCIVEGDQPIRPDEE